MHKHKIILYTLNDCIYCNDLKWKLDQLDIKYTEIDADDKSKYELIRQIEMSFQTETYPILYLNEIPKYRTTAFISKTDLEPQDGIHIFESIDEIIIKLKQIYEI